MEPPLFIVNCKGGIGNQLFQVFFAISQHLEYGVHYAINIDECPKFSHYLFFFANLLSPDSLTIPPTKYIENREPELHALETIQKLETTYFDGYFQDYRYFHKHGESIKKILHIEWMREKVKHRIRHKVDFDDDSTRIMLHIRRGDYVGQTCYHPVLDTNYYIESIRCIMDSAVYAGKPVRLFVFCQKGENSREIVDAVSREVGEHIESIHYMADYCLTDAEELLCMTWCTHFIIANSTYSWWGAYLCPYREKVVCCPDAFFGHQLYYINTTGLYMDNWKRIWYKRICHCGGWTYT